MRLLALTHKPPTVAIFQVFYKELVEFEEQEVDDVDVLAEATAAHRCSDQLAELFSMIRRDGVHVC